MALFCAELWPALLVVASIAGPTFAFADATDNRSPDLHANPSIFAYAGLVLEARNISIPFPDIQGAAGQKTIDFILIGNIPVKVHAEPDSRIQIGGRNLGKATSGTEAVGYDVAISLGRKWGSQRSGMTEPSAGANSSSGTSAVALEKELSATGHGRTGWFWYKKYGELTVKTYASWSANGGLPLAGNYVGQVTITLTPDF